MMLAWRRATTQIIRKADQSQQWMLSLWIGRAGFAVMDQAVFSGSNFLLNLLLVRWLDPAAVGAFALSFAAFLFFAGFHNALVLEPATILGASKPATEHTSYLGDVFWLHLGVSTVSGGIMVVFGFIVSSPMLRGALWTMGLATPIVLLEWLFRRACYLRSDAKGAFLSSCGYGVTLLGTTWLFHAINVLSPRTAVAAMILASFVGMALRWRRLSVSVRRFWAPQVAAELRSVMASHWSLGGWIALQALLLLAGSYAQTFLTGAMIGLEGAGRLRALTLVTLPIGQMMNAVGSVLALPVLARNYSQQNTQTFQKALRLLLCFNVGIAVTYEVGLFALRDPIARFLLKDEGSAIAWLVPVVGLSPLFSALAVYGLALRAAQQAWYYPISGMVSAVSGLITALLFIVLWDVPGAVMSTIFSSAAVSFISWYLYRRWLSDPSVEPGRPASERAEAKL